MAEQRYSHPLPKDGRTGIAGSLGALAEDASRLVHLEIELLKQEILGLVKQNAIAAGMLLGAALCALMFLIFTLVLVIVLIPYHAVTAAVIAILWLAGGIGLALAGKSRLRISAPDASIESLKEDLEWVKQQLKPEPK